MPRLFWKLFFALWLSIMAFAVVVSWINHSIQLQNTIEQPVFGFEANQAQFRSRLVRALESGDEKQAVRLLKALPRGMQRHIYILDADGNDLLGRNPAADAFRPGRSRPYREGVSGPDGIEYTLLFNSRPVPPRAIFEPGKRGVGLRLAVAALISALVSLVLARYLAAPLVQLRHASRRLAAGDLGSRVGPPLDRRKDEFGQLATDLDEMAARLQILQQGNQRLLRDVSHELRSPLTRLRVALEIARNKGEAVIADELDRMELESHRLEALVDEVLGLLRETSGPQQLRPTQFDLAELLQDLVESVNYELKEEQAQVTANIAAPLTVNGDRELLWRAFENLLRNALIHSGQAAGIRVDAEVVADDEIIVSVKDRGPGIAGIHLERIFEPFYRVDEARSRSVPQSSGGHGLGLAIAASAIRRHGGRVSANNRGGGGLEVRVSLPASALPPDAK